MGSVETGPLS